MKTNYHSHTTRCKHANGRDEEYVISAIKGGLTEIGFSDHCPWPFEGDYVSRIRMDVEQMDDYVQQITALQVKYKDQISIKIGLECEYYEEFIPWLTQLKEHYHLDYFIFGNHFPENETRSYYTGSGTTTPKHLENYLQTAIKAMESGLFTYFAHPDLFMVSYKTFDKHCENMTRQLCLKAKEVNMPLEFNISGYLYQEQHDTPHGYPHKDFWKIAKEVGCQAIIGYDAHTPLVYETNKYYDRAKMELAALGIEVIPSLSFN
ncbi:MAG TPA: histidinol phosphatase [Firmicutes bacterium]|nr:histidinol phosphatase [Bacillota bacterium]